MVKVSWVKPGPDGPRNLTSVLLPRPDIADPANHVGFVP